MLINQLAKNQQLMYNFISRAADTSSPWETLTNSSQLNSQLSSQWDMEKRSATVDPDSLLQQMGMSGLKGRTIRDMVKYKMEQAQEKAQAAQQLETAPDIDLAALKQQLSARALTTPISDEATRAMQDLALQDARDSVGKVTASDSLNRVKLIQEQLQNVSPSKRAAAFNTMNKVWQDEVDRIGAYIKEKDPSWNIWGDKFDTSILNDYKTGINIWT